MGMHPAMFRWVLACQMGVGHENLLRWLHYSDELIDEAWRLMTRFGLDERITPEFKYDAYAQNCSAEFVCGLEVKPGFWILTENYLLSTVGLVAQSRKKTQNQSLFMITSTGHTGRVVLALGEESSSCRWAFGNTEKEVGSLGTTALHIVFGEV